MQNSIEIAQKKFSSIPEIDLHFYGMKGYGIVDNEIELGRPKFHLIDSRKLFSVVPIISSEKSPYAFKRNKLTYKRNKLPFTVKHIGRIIRNPAYFYFRGIQEWMPTLDSETILSINFQPICRGCEWCCREIEKKMRNISPEEGIDILKRSRVDFTSINKMTFVTGMYRSEDEAVDNIIKTVNLTKKYGFNGRVLYIGLQIKSPYQVKLLLRGLKGTAFKYAYTLETFTQRERMHSIKSGSLEDIISIFNSLITSGVTDLEYSYMPGIDPLKDFFIWMPKLSKLARPHLSIFRPTETYQENLKTPEFIDNPVGYLCSMRTAFEKEYGGPNFQNNLASLWGFPINRVNPLFLTDKTCLS